MQKLTSCLGIICLLSCLLYLPKAHAQDPQFSQFYAAPLYLNPAFAGSTQQARVGANYRNQWLGLSTSFETISAYFDYYFEDYNSGVGVIAWTDAHSLSGLRMTSVGGQYAYQLPVTNEITVRAGAYGAYVFGDFSYTNLRFADQFDGDGFNNPTNESGDRSLNNYFDLGIGGLAYAKDWWIGYSAMHLTRPDQSSIGASSILPMRHSVHGGYRFHLPIESFTKELVKRKKERSVTPAFHYKHQGGFNQLDLGAYATLEPLTVGVWYRGIPINAVEGELNNESVIFLVGFRSSGGFSMGYSFDYTLSKLTIQSGGAHEVSVIYEFPIRDPRTPAKNVRKIPCPRF